MKNNCYFRDPINMEAANLDEEVSVKNTEEKN